MSYIDSKRNIFALSTPTDGMEVKAGNTIGIDTAPQPVFTGLTPSVVLHSMQTDATKVFLIDHFTHKPLGEITKTTLSYKTLGDLAKVADPTWNGHALDIGVSLNATAVASDTQVHMKIVASDGFC